MVLKRIIRQYLNQHVPENIRPTQKLDRKSAKILEDLTYFNKTPIPIRILRGERKLANSRIFPLTSVTDQAEHEYSGNLLKMQHDPFFKDIQQSPTFTQSLEKSNVHHQTKLCKDYFLQNIAQNVNKNIISANQWTGLDINRLTSRTKYYKIRKTKELLFSLNRYRAALKNKNRRYRSSIYKLQLKERKKLSLLYGNLSKKEIYRTIQKAEKYRGALRDNILRVLESRLDVILYRVGFFKSIPTARQWIIHRKILVNHQVVTIAHYQVKAGDVVSVDPRKACALIEMIDSRLQETIEFESHLQQAANFSAESDLQQEADFSAESYLEQLLDLYPESDLEEEPGLPTECYVEQVAALWPFIVDRRALKKMFKFGIVHGLNKIIFRAAKKIIERQLITMKSSGMNFLKMRKKVRICRKFLYKQRKRYWKKKISFNSRYDKKFFHSKQKFKDTKKYNRIFLKKKKRLSNSKEEYKKQLVSYLETQLMSRFDTKNTQTVLDFDLFKPIFESIEKLQKMEIIASIANQEYGFKLRDPLFTYKCLLLLKIERPSTFFFEDIDANVDVKKPLHLEVSYKTLTAVYLYSPQKLFFPANIDIDAVKKSYY